MSLDRAGSAATARRRSLVCLPRVARWNSWSPAAHPSSPRASWARSPGGSGSPYTSANSRSTSHDRNRRSSWPISSSAPDTRSRDRFQPGAWRQVAASTSHGGASSTRSPRASSAGEPASSCRSSRARTTRPSGTGTRSSASAASSAPPQPPAPAGTSPGTTAARAWAMCPSSAAARRSPASTRYQAVGVVSADVYCASSVVLPQPAGPVTSTSRWWPVAARDRSSRSRGRARTGGGRMRARGTAPSGTCPSPSCAGPPPAASTTPPRRPRGDAPGRRHRSSLR